MKLLMPSKISTLKGTWDAGFHSSSKMEFHNTEPINTQHCARTWSLSPRCEQHRPITGTVLADHNMLNMYYDAQNLFLFFIFTFMIVHALKVTKIIFVLYCRTYTPQRKDFSIWYNHSQLTMGGLGSKLGSLFLMSDKKWSDTPDKFQNCSITNGNYS